MSLICIVIGNPTAIQFQLHIMQMDWNTGPLEKTTEAEFFSSNGKLHLTIYNLNPLEHGKHKFSFQDGYFQCEDPDMVIDLLFYTKNYELQKVVFSANARKGDNEVNLFWELPIPHMERLAKWDKHFGFRRMKGRKIDLN
jgi:hypothetical protein